MDTMQKVAVSLAVLGALAVLIEILIKDPKAALEIVADVEAFARRARPAATKSGARILFRRRGAIPTADVTGATAVRLPVAITLKDATASAWQKSLQEGRRHD